jgi:hypothetical protein
MSNDYKFEGWVGLDANAAKGNMVWQSYEPKAFQETDIDVRYLNHTRSSHGSLANITNRSRSLTAVSAVPTSTLSRPAGVPPTTLASLATRLSARPSALARTSRTASRSATASVLVLSLALA